MKTIFRILDGGMVFWKYWGGWRGSYASAKPSQSTFDSREDAIKFIDNMSSWDGGMGFEDELWAIYRIESVTSTEINGKVFNNIEDEEDIIVWNLSDEEIDFLYNI